MSIFTLTFLTANVYQVRSKNGLHVANFLRDVDGTFYCEFIGNNNGLWSDHALKELADTLYKINKPTYEHYEQDFLGLQEDLDTEETDIFG